MECLWDVQADLGEGPLWLPAEQALLFVDIDGRRLHRYDLGDGATHTWSLPRRVGCVVPRRAGGFLLAGEAGLSLLDHWPAGERAEPRAWLDPEADVPGNRFNDGVCDGAGRLWTGSMDLACRQPRGALWRIDPDGGAAPMATGYAVSNGPAFAPDGRTLYHADTVAGVVEAFACDPASGDLGERREFARLSPGQGLPDGLTVDARGGVWAALWDGGQVVRWHADGRLDRAWPVPAARPTKCAFGGPDLDLLFVTSSRGGLDPEALAARPRSGGLFAFRPGVAGLPAQAFAG